MAEWTCPTYAMACYRVGWFSLASPAGSRRAQSLLGSAAARSEEVVVVVAVVAWGRSSASLRVVLVAGAVLVVGEAAAPPKLKTGPLLAGASPNFEGPPDAVSTR